MGKIKSKRKLIVDLLFDFYKDKDNLNCTLVNDVLPIEVSDDNLCILPQKRIKHLISDSMDLNYFWKKAVDLNPAFSICGLNEDLSIDEINNQTTHGIHLRSSIVLDFINFLRPKQVLGDVYVAEPRNLLEIGPGFGGMKDYFKEELPYIKWYGMDVNCLFKHPRLYRTDGYNIPDKLKDKDISLVYSLNVFQHLSKKQRSSYYKQIFDLLPKNGIFVFGLFVTFNDNLNQRLEHDETKWLYGHRDNDDNPYTVFFSQLTECEDIEDITQELTDIGFTINLREIMRPNYGVFLVTK